MEQQKIVITGGPGTGKSAVIEKLLNLEFTCMPEISRMITREAQQTGIEQLFLKEPLLFSEMLLQGRIDQYETAEKLGHNIVFFDRGIPDILGYLDYVQLDYPKDFFHQSLKFSYSKVFMMPPWKDIYQTDNERYETFEQSLVIYDFLVKAYEKLDYEIITVPENKIENRVEFILNAMES